jgi:acylphosphatase
LPNGDVEVQAEADAPTLTVFRHELERGPRMAHVTEIMETDIPASGAYSSFFIRG